MRLPKLYKRSAATGTIWTWEIETATSPLEFPHEAPGVIVTRHGQLDGQIQESREVIRAGKNVGKKNSTTPVQQAEAEALAEHEKKRARQGYVEDLARAQRGETDAEGGIAPMLAKPLEDAERHLRYPLDLQRKYNGIRLIVTIIDGDVSLWSRKRERVVSLPHVEAAYRMAFVGHRGYTAFDGEAYRHGWSLQRIASIVRQKKTPHADHEQVSHHVYDLPSSAAPWDVRRAELAGLLPAHPIARLVETVTVNTLDAAWALHDVWVGEGYEGAIARNRHAVYQAGKRSADLQKLKRFDSTEHEIVAVGQGRGKFEGLAVFTCRAANGRTFECSAPGSFEDRAEYLARGDELIGKRLTVKYFGLSDDGIPLFPVAEAVREID